PIVAGLTGMVAALLFAITLLTLVSNARLGRTNQDLDAKKTALGLALDEQAQLRAHAQDQAWEANVQATRAGHFSGREGQRFKGLANLTKAMELKPGHAALDVRNEAVGCLVLPDLEVAKEFPWPYASTMATFNRDLTRYARVDTEGRVVIHRVADN